MSWFPGAYQSKFGQLLGRICEPFLDLFSTFAFSIWRNRFFCNGAILALNIAMEVLQKNFV